jgi:hypothetical protein
VKSSAAPPLTTTLVTPKAALPGKTLLISNVRVTVPPDTRACTAQISAVWRGVVFDHHAVTQYGHLRTHTRALHREHIRDPRRVTVAVCRPRVPGVNLVDAPGNAGDAGAVVTTN